MGFRAFYMAPDEAAGGGGEAKGDEKPITKETATEVKKELAAVTAEAKKIEAAVSKGEISGMSESTGHAILETLRELRKDLAQSKGGRKGLFF